MLESTSAHLQDAETSQKKKKRHCLHDFQGTLYTPKPKQSPPNSYGYHELLYLARGQKDGIQEQEGELGVSFSPPNHQKKKHKKIQLVKI